MLTPDNFLQATQWIGITTLTFAGLTGLSFLLKWGIRFRLVGVTAFSLVLTVGCFGLSVVPFAPTVVPGSINYTLVFDNGANLITIKVPSDITESELEATLRQAAINLVAPGRLSPGRGQLLLRARTVIHPEPGISKPLYLGRVMQSPSRSEDGDPFAIEIYRDNLAQLSS
ncbi:Ycf51 family protein [Oscillatoriales cyanobacterium LEGE 11467]|uniref:Ycf51 family protein n=2 Tax=Zarconia TaxID=2992130 RepID=A0A928Z872_9CYAN|nr:Ycf51 family protein [Zarconia navalis LEGE 11467]